MTMTMPAEPTVARPPPTREEREGLRRLIAAEAVALGRWRETPEDPGHHLLDAWLKAGAAFLKAVRPMAPGLLDAADARDALAADLLRAADEAERHPARYTGAEVAALLRGLAGDGRDAG